MIKSRLNLAGIFIVIVCLALSPSPGWGWHGKGHELITRAAVLSLPEELPEFFRQAGPMVAHCSLDPDAFTRPIAPDQLHNQESVEHFFDLERLDGVPIPPLRYDFLKYCAENTLDPAGVGLLPYAVVEWTQRLSVAFAEHRRWPENPYIRQKALVYAGILAHYAADLNQPLHLTIHWDGKAGEDGKSPRTGIHAKVDALPGKLPDQPEKLASADCVPAFDQLMPAVMEQITRTHALVDRVYGLEAWLVDWEDPIDPDSPPAVFARSQARESARFIASLFLTAWRDSKHISEDFPPWYVRQQAPQPAVEPAKP